MIDMNHVARAYLVGIKGTGMAALAELLHARGAAVTGSDTADVFYTDAILRGLGIPFHEGFDAGHLDAGPRPDLVIHSAAYDPAVNPELIAARALGVPVLKYPDALGAYSALFDSSGIAGVHGKTTTTALAGCLARAAGLPAQVLAGSAVAGFGAAAGGAANGAAGANGARSTLVLARDPRFFIAETCEYRRHFLSFHPRRIVLTSVESDHQDYYPDYPSIRDAFVEYCRLLPPGGTLIHCADDAGAAEVASIVRAERPDVTLVPYGFTAPGPYGITSCGARGERLVFTLRGDGDAPGADCGAGFEWRLRVPGRHTALNATAALALIEHLARSAPAAPAVSRAALAEALEKTFTGSKRRSEILGEAGGVLFMDDYAHHPTAIRTTLQGLREFYPRRRLVVSFMSHTYSRTAALLDDFAAALADGVGGDGGAAGGDGVLCLHRIYASARETRGSITGRTLYERVEKLLGKRVFYTEDPLDAVDVFMGRRGGAGSGAGNGLAIRPGDLFITLGAGDNWKLGRALFAEAIARD